jgi:hypothetical protein
MKTITTTNQLVIIDNPNIYDNSPNPNIQNQHNNIINRIGIILNYQDYQNYLNQLNQPNNNLNPVFLILVGKSVCKLALSEFSILSSITTSI